MPENASQKRMLIRSGAHGELPFRLFEGDVLAEAEDAVALALHELSLQPDRARACPNRVGPGVDPLVRRQQRRSPRGDIPNVVVVRNDQLRVEALDCLIDLRWA